MVFEPPIYAVQRKWNDTECHAQRGVAQRGASIFGNLMGSKMPLKLNVVDAWFAPEGDGFTCTNPPPEGDTQPSFSFQDVTDATLGTFTDAVVKPIYQRLLGWIDKEHDEEMRKHGVKHGPHPTAFYSEESIADMNSKDLKAACTKLGIEPSYSKKRARASGSLSRREFLSDTTRTNVLAAVAAKLAKVTKKFMKKAPKKPTYDLQINVTKAKAKGGGPKEANTKVSELLWSRSAQEPAVSHKAAAAISAILNDTMRMSETIPCLFVQVKQADVTFPMFTDVVALPWVAAPGAVAASSDSDLDASSSDSDDSDS